LRDIVAGAGDVFVDRKVLRLAAVSVVLLLKCFLEQKGLSNVKLNDAPLLMMID
jgi:hypothetical protein